MRLKFAIIVLTLSVGVGSYFLYSFLFQPPKSIDVVNTVIADKLLGWKIPNTMLPDVGSIPSKLAYSAIRPKSDAPTGLPVQLKISTIGVNSQIEDAFITPEGRMDVPAGSKNVAWFALGPKPGAIGSAVIGGHFGITNGVPFVFYNLDKLKAGDHVSVVNDKGITLTFIVRSTKLFDRSADAESVFASSDGLAHLNLVTCEGAWNEASGNYPKRLVVFTDLIAT